MKKIHFGTRVAIGVLFSVIVLLLIVRIAMPWSSVFFDIYFGQKPSSPEIMYGEFPCRLEYELDGELKVIQDTIICEFDGFETRGEAGKYRKWKTRLKSGNERLTLLDLRTLEEKDNYNHRILELFFSFDNGAYYMGDASPGTAPRIENYVEYLYLTEEGKIGGSGFSSNQAYERYGIRLIKWEVADPIQNSFK